MRDPTLAVVLSAIIPGLGQLALQRPYPGRHPVAGHHAGLMDRHRGPARLGLSRHSGLHRLHLRPRSPGACLKPAIRQRAWKKRSPKCASVTPNRMGVRVLISVFRLSSVS
jgi:hypothetical protein